MKTYRTLSVLILVVSGWITSFGQEVQPEVPGDQFSLEGALELFKKSSSPEEFEKMLNSPDSKVNNLDLNGDGYIDYIRVQDRYEGNVHAFILQAVISESELQDVAVIELEKLANGKAVLQIVGNEDIYGIETIIEPTQEVRTYAGTQSSPTVVNVWTWPSVQYVYSPYYAGWVSPWGWYERPVWWRRWRPVAYVHYYPIWRPYHRHYAVCYTRRVVYAHQIYRPYRSSSVVVRSRHRDQLVRYRSEHRNDGRNRYDDGRIRNDDRRITMDDRSSRQNTNVTERRARTSDLNRSSSSQREIETPSRSATRQQSVRTEVRRDPAELRRTDTPIRRTAPTPGSRDIRQEATAPSVNRSRSSSSQDIQQRPASNERSVRTEVRQPSELRRQAPERTRSESINNSRPVPKPAPTRSSTVDRRSTPSPSPGVQQRSAPTRSASPTVQHRSTSRPSEGTSRSGTPSRGRQ